MEQRSYVFNREELSTEKDVICAFLGRYVAPLGTQAQYYERIVKAIDAVVPSGDVVGCIEVFYNGVCRTSFSQNIAEAPLSYINLTPAMFGQTSEDQKLNQYKQYKLPS